jgi:hypothetical protein
LSITYDIWISGIASAETGVYICYQKIFMKQITALFLVFSLFASCNFIQTTGSGNIVKEKRVVSDFSEISASGSFDVEVNIGPVTLVTVEADDNIMPYIETEVSGDQLKIKTENLHSLSNAHLKVYVTTPELKKIKASASAKVNVLDLLKNNDRLDFDASSSGNIEAVVYASDVKAETSSGATVILSGRAKEYRARASSGSTIRSGDLLSEKADVSVSSGANIKVYASELLEAGASSGGQIRYLGAATVRPSVSSGGSVEKGE